MKDRNRTRQQRVDELMELRRRIAELEALENGCKRAAEGLALRSTAAEVYTDHDLGLAESIGNQIAGAIANAQLWDDRKRAEGEKEKLQEQLLQAQKTEAIGTLAGGIAHDFDNILSAILGYAELAHIEMKEDSRAKRNLQDSMKAAHRAKDLVQHLLSFSRQSKHERKPLMSGPSLKRD